MGSLSLEDMRRYLSRPRRNRRRRSSRLDVIAAFRQQLDCFGFARQFFCGGLLVRCARQDGFVTDDIALIPERIKPDISYSPGCPFSKPDLGAHTICSAFQQSGIGSYFCSPRILTDDDPTTVQWFATQLGLPWDEGYIPVENVLRGKFSLPRKRHAYLRYTTDVSALPGDRIADEFSKENLRVYVRSAFRAEISDIDGIFWGQHRTYPLEIKEKTAGNDSGMGEFFGLDVGPFVKLAFYAAKRGNLHSLFIVREITDTDTRELKQWWFVTFDTLAQFASWTPMGGGMNMGGGGSTVIKIPKARFSPLTAEELARL